MIKKLLNASSSSHYAASNEHECFCWKQRKQISKNVQGKLFMQIDF